MAPPAKRLTSDARKSSVGKIPAPDATLSPSRAASATRSGAAPGTKTVLAAEHRLLFSFALTCFWLAQREFGLLGRDCRTTKMRQRDARAAIAANAARIRLCMKTVVAGVTQSPGTNEGTRKAEKSKT
jgi:hypothetical protein